MTNQLEATLRDRLTDAETGWSMGSFGAIAEFHQDSDEVTVIDEGANLRRATSRGGIHIKLSGQVRPVAYEAVSPRPHRWSHGVALCLPEDASVMNCRTVVTELGTDRDALREEDRDTILFDMGLCAAGPGCRNVDFCVRADEPELIATLRAACGQSMFDSECRAMPAILQSHPHRVALTRLGRVEVYQLIGGPATGGKSPPGPHTHVLPKLMASGRTHSANQPIPDGQIPCAMMYPGNPVIGSLGEDRDFDNALHDAFQKLFWNCGSEDQVAAKRQALDALKAGQPPESIGPDRSPASRIAVRVLCRQLKRDSRTELDGQLLERWCEFFDQTGQSGDEDGDPTDVFEGEGH